MRSLLCLPLLLQTPLADAVCGRTLPRYHLKSKIHPLFSQQKLCIVLQLKSVSCKSAAHRSLSSYKDSLNLSMSSSAISFETLCSGVPTRSSTSRSESPYFYSVGLDEISIGKVKIPKLEILKLVGKDGGGRLVVDSGTTFMILPMGFHRLSEMKKANPNAMSPINYISYKIYSHLACKGSFDGLEAAITDYKGNPIALKNAKIVVESEDENKIQLWLQVLWHFWNATFLGTNALKKL